MQAASVLSAWMMRGRVFPCTQPAGREGGETGVGLLVPGRRSVAEDVSDFLTSVVQRYV